MAGVNARFAKLLVSNVVKSIADFGVSSLSDDDINFAQIQVEGGELRYRYDGDGDPTTAEGMLQRATDPQLYLEGVARLRDLRMIRNGAVDVTVSITFDNKTR